MKTFCGLKCSVTPHSSLNTSKGVICCPALSRVTSDNIKEGIAEKGITDVRRITVRCDGVIKPTNTHVLTFNSPNLPTVVKNRLYASESRCLYTKLTSMLQLSSVWSPLK